MGAGIADNVVKPRSARRDKHSFPNNQPSQLHDNFTTNPFFSTRIVRAHGNSPSAMESNRLFRFPKPAWMNSANTRTAGVYIAGALVLLLQSTWNRMH